MATILKAATGDATGVVTFTTQERDGAINAVPEVRAAVERLKSRWIVGLHHNWHDYSFRYDPLFDFSMAGADDLREVGGRPFPLVPLDACNFTPEVFSPGRDEPFWDVLFVARAVFFKRIPEFFRVIRELYDGGHALRVLLLCPVPPYVTGDEKTVFYGIRDAYESLFSEAEQDWFNLITMEWRYPFPLDLPTLAHFYRSSRVFVHTADDERRCRVAAYAWATGLPVVGLEPIGSLLSPGLRRPPWLFEARRDADFAPKILAALDAYPISNASLAAVRSEVAATETRATLTKMLQELALNGGRGWDGEALALEKLDIRLGRHHGLADPGPNFLPQTVENLAAVLLSEPERVRAAMVHDDPELELAGTRPSIAADPAPRRRRWRR